jgi:hypothetical protein
MMVVKNHQRSVANLLPLTQTIEQRGKPRIQCSYTAIVSWRRGKERFKEQAILSNMSASGMYLRLRQDIQPGDSLFILVRLSTAPLDKVNAPIIAASGTVVRQEEHSGGIYGIGLKLRKHRFL